MQIARRFHVARDGVDGFGDRCRIELRADQRRHIEPQRAIADAADAERDIDAAPVLIERDLRRGSNEGEIRSAAR